MWANSTKGTFKSEHWGTKRKILIYHETSNFHVFLFELKFFKIMFSLILINLLTFSAWCIKCVKWISVSEVCIIYSRNYDHVFLVLIAFNNSTVCISAKNWDRELENGWPLLCSYLSCNAPSSNSRLKVHFVKSAHINLI